MVKPGQRVEAYFGEAAFTGVVEKISHGHDGTRTIWVRLDRAPNGSGGETLWFFAEKDVRPLTNNRRRGRMTRAVSSVSAVSTIEASRPQQRGRPVLAGGTSGGTPRRQPRKHLICLWYLDNFGGRRLHHS